MRVTFPKRRRPAESIVPMINVVFLLLIFFLMTAQITPPEPFAVVLPAAERDDPAEGPLTLHLSDQGVLAFRTHFGEDAMAQAVEAAGDQPLQLRADAGVDAARVAELIHMLAKADIRSVILVTAAP